MTHKTRSKSALPLIEASDMLGLLRQWEARRVKKVDILKMLQLWLGQTQFMRPSNYSYEATAFTEIRKSLKYDSVNDLIKVVRQTNSFYLMMKKSDNTVTGFYSPITANLVKVPADQYMIEPQINTPVFPQKCSADSGGQHTDNEAKDEKSGPSASSGCQYIEIAKAIDVRARDPRARSINSNGNRMTDPTPETIEASSKFCEALLQDKLQLHIIFDSWTQQLQRELNISETEAWQVVEVFIRKKVHTHFARRRGLERWSYDWMAGWLSKLLQSRIGRQRMDEAVALWSQQRRDTARESQRSAMDQHPISPYEFMQTGTSQRIYFDPVEGIYISIPTDAPPRPSDTAIWNVIDKNWN